MPSCKTPSAYSLAKSLTAGTLPPLDYASRFPKDATTECLNAPNERTPPKNRYAAHRSTPTGNFTSHALPSSSNNTIARDSQSGDR